MPKFQAGLQGFPPGYGHAMSEVGNPVTPEDDEAEATEETEEGVADNPDVDDE